MANIEKLVPFILRWEGGYVNDPLDKGGETNKGITIAVWRSRGHDCTVKLGNVKVGKRVYSNVTKSLYEMTDAQWSDILKSLYWDRWCADQIANQAVANVLVDWVWASGVHGIKIPQRILGVVDDGVVGPKTVAALNARRQDDLFAQIKQARINFCETIVRNNPSQKRFLNGWLNRIKEFKFAE